jgi:hypothetical protein
MRSRVERTDNGKGVTMTREVTCPPCGEIIRGESDDELIANARQHSVEHEHQMPAGMTDEQINAHILSEAREVSYSTV